MTTKTDELKPCPFCGCANIHITPDEVGSGGQWVGPVHVVCGGDCVAGQSGDDRESAIAAWNRRAALQSQDAEDAERLKYLLGKVCMYQAADYGCKFEILNLPPHFGDCEPDPIQPFLAAIDHARRVEGADDA